MKRPRRRRRVPQRDVFTVAAVFGALPGLVVIVLYANRFGLIHLVPVAGALVPFAAWSWKSAVLLRLMAAGLFGVIVILGAMTVGVFFVPSAVLMVVGAVRAANGYDSERRSR
ncbi:MAG: hypothetical protein F4139_13870 [Gemmatimonadetes bacterium]|nr:hypothetical protein [Gemmatimonadota bacterium]MYH54009.1 hypothetical protein [Gemmatimonadota bacterium]MYK65577.1 hypothetical protein [Gemmatimonadota bacterium]